MKLAVRVLLSVAAAAVLLWLLARWGGVEWGDVVAALERLSPRTWAAAFAVHLGIYTARTQRYRALIPSDERPRFGATFSISAAHNLAAYVLPARSGEASIVLYLKALCGVSGRAALASLVVSRALDLATLAGSLGAITLFLSSGERWAVSPELGYAAGGGLLVLTLFFALASARGEWLVTGFSRSLNAVGLGKTALGAKVLERAGQLSEALTRARTGGNLPLSVLLSLVVWAGVFGFYAILAQGLGLPSGIGFLEAAFGSSLAVLTNILPINAMAGFGTQETGWVLGFGLLGVDRELAFSTGVGVHLVQLAHVVALGALGHLVMGFLRPPQDTTG